MKYFFTCLLLLFLFLCTKKEKDKPVVMKILPDYPSASAVEYANGKLYVMGDDATSMLLLDTNLNVIDSMQLFGNETKRIAKNIKHDLESVLFVRENNQLMLLGSGSLSPYRNSAWLVNIDTKIRQGKSIEHFYNIVRNAGIKEINIEGSVKINNEYILANRGHLAYPENHLIFTQTIFNAEPVMVSTISVRYKPDSLSFQGISGLTYSSLNDALIMTVSTEKTASTFEDGAIGKSYIWLINGISQPSDANELKPDRVIDLEELDSIFKGYKIESATVISETKDMLRLVLVADNDNGSSTIFKLSIKIN
jgi:hypothetical protein